MASNETVIIVVQPQTQLGPRKKHKVKQQSVCCAVQRGVLWSSTLEKPKSYSINAQHRRATSTEQGTAASEG